MMSEGGGYGGVCDSMRARIMVYTTEDGEVRPQRRGAAGRLPGSRWYGINKQHVGLRIEIFTIEFLLVIIVFG
jgi:hypothetical protein